MKPETGKRRLQVNGDAELIQDLGKRILDSGI